MSRLVGTIVVSLKVRSWCWYGLANISFCHLWDEKKINFSTPSASLAVMCVCDHWPSNCWFHSQWGERKKNRGETLKVTDQMILFFQPLIFFLRYQSFLLLVYIFHDIASFCEDNSGWLGVAWLKAINVKVEMDFWWKKDAFLFSIVYYSDQYDFLPTDNFAFIQ